MKKLLFAIMACVLCIGLVGGAFAYFDDTETSYGNTFTAGTLDLKVDNQDDNNVVSINLGNMKPGDDTGYYKWCLKNAGSMPGKVSVTFSIVVNNENGVVEPETAAEAAVYASSGGELGQYLKPGVEPEVAEAAGAIIIERNDDEGWYIAYVDSEIDTGGTIGWAPCGWSVPSRLYSVWQAGPTHPWGIPGLMNLSGNTYGTLSYLPGDVLNPGETVGFFFRVKLDPDLRLWDGTKWVDIDDNLIQSDSVVFDITFKLEQVP
jgi:predicted ribosomally synthesized peptide with SipW-like signal peptide